MRQIIGVDGTFPTFLNTLSKDGFKTNKKGNSVKPLVTGLFNITSNYPVMLNWQRIKMNKKHLWPLQKIRINLRAIYLFLIGDIEVKIF